MKNIFIKTYGCQMNVYDSQRMLDLLAPHGYGTTELLEHAHMIILNTCHIREKAAEKLYSDLGRLRFVKEDRLNQGQECVLVVAGCVAQAEGAEIMRRAPFVDMVVGPQSYQTLPELLRNFQTTNQKQIATEFPAEPKFDALPEETNVEGASAFVAIQEGCDKFCTFCVVPYTRGAEYSRPVADVLKEAKMLVDKGVQELTLLGQNVNAYHGDDNGRTVGLGELCLRLAELDGVVRLRYMTSHPRDMDEVLIQAHGKCEKLMPFLHLPVQSGSDRILQAMNRKHTAQEYYTIIDRLRAVRPEIALSSDFIVGFPGETEEDFQQTMKLVSDVGFAQAYSFKYSPRPGTPASIHELQVEEHVKDRRLAELQALLSTQQKSFNQSKVGQILPVLFDRMGKQEGQLLGKSPYLQSVHANVKGDRLGQIINVKITGATLNSLTGESIVV